MRTPIAWLNLTHEKNRLLVAIAGVSFAVILVFMNLGFLGSLAKTAAILYGQIDAEIFLISPQSLEISTTKPFPIERIYQAAGVNGVERVMPLYVGYLQWRNPETRRNRAIFVYGMNPEDPVFIMPELKDPKNLAALRRPDTALIDRLSRPEFGSQTTGTVTEAKRRQITIGGQYSMGGGFAADGTLILSDQNFRRYFDPFPLNLINLGLIKLKPGVNPQQIAVELKRVLPPDVSVYTQEEIIARDRDYWINTTSTGFIFTMGVAVSCVVGVVIVYQILYTDISDHMKQYATLKAMGYRSRFLFGVVLQEAVILAVLGYIPGFAVSLGLYDLTVRATSGGLPMTMELERAIFVLLLTLVMCSLSALISVRRVVTTDPAEVF
ncbi:ABC transporter permease DevC [Leptolyngbya sp. FACHB-711]|uniref:ABC transporter permease DevC n=1 Tax=unclassified Leptolyngbya TaxID=2650499 RepID=UPI001684DFDA|nr:ABC transporter permease DevC [Leptolyngbya sp. FACHB-711]MBD1849858.1 FtsX-like permease family protein [Cyanobacteria bacterium FACHB-502]MBD2023142.1 FtsX-like permease family protein [Leptolyngbya sp. FACHB-711]